LKLAVSTSSAQTSLALIEGRDVRWFEEEMAPMRSSAALTALWDRCQIEVGVDLDAIDGFWADLGPGSFTGVRVGVVWAKALAWLAAKPCGGALAFDLIAPDRKVVFPSRKGEFYVRVPGQAVVRSVESDLGGAVGFGFGGTDVYPHAARFAFLDVESVDPFDLVPIYGMEPSISTPKKPYAGPLGRAGERR